MRILRPLLLSTRALFLVVFLFVLWFAALWGKDGLKNSEGFWVVFATFETWKSARLRVLFKASAGPGGTILQLDVEASAVKKTMPAGNFLICVL